MADGSSNSSAASVATGEEVQLPALLCSTYYPATPCVVLIAFFVAINRAPFF
jgi:hypothetical protein